MAAKRSPEEIQRMLEGYRSQYPIRATARQDRAAFPIVRSAFVYYISPTQINVLTPPDQPSVATYIGQSTQSGFVVSIAGTL